MVYRTSRRVTGNAHDAEDAAQQVFATLAQLADRLTDSKTLAGWLYATAWRASMHVRRARETRRRHEPRAARPELAGPNGLPDEDALNELYRAIEMLPTEYREAIVLHHLSGLTIEQVSELMACSVGTTAARISRGRAWIRERFTWRGAILTNVGLDALLALDAARHHAGGLDVAQWLSRTTEEWLTEGGNPASACVAIAPAPAARLWSRPTAAAAGGGGSLAVATSGVRLAMMACLAALITTVPLGAAYVHFFGPSSSRVIRISGGGYGSAESRSAGYSAASARSSSSSSAASVVPEPTSSSLVAAAVLAVSLRRPRRRRAC
jgi:RNA polymerase sigma-70 factor (ECF subfamily)